MSAGNEAPELRVEWKALEAHQLRIRSLHLRQLFDADPLRGERLCAEACGIHLDYSKNRISDETVALLIGLARACGLRERIEVLGGAFFLEAGTGRGLTVRGVLPA